MQPTSSPPVAEFLNATFSFDARWFFRKEGQEHSPNMKLRREMQSPLKPLDIEFVPCDFQDEFFETSSHGFAVNAGTVSDDIATVLVAL